MNQKMHRGGRGAPSEDLKHGWATLIGDDALGIDGDIERLIGSYQAKYGYTRTRANAELVLRLSTLACPRAALLDDPRCA